jgi:alpha-beta hydrolase superfamily lysophospholipase
VIYRVERQGVALGEVVAEMAVHVWEPPGSTRSVLCLHSYLGTGLDFQPLAKMLAGSGITVIAPDLMGRGQSSFPGPGAALSLRAVLVCLSVAAALQKPAACQLGSIWGGIVLLSWLAATGYRSRGLVLDDVPLAPGPAVSRLRTAAREEIGWTSRDPDLAVEEVTAGRVFADDAERRAFAAARLMQFDGVWRRKLDPGLALSEVLETDFDLVPPLAAAPMPVLWLPGPDTADTNPAGLAALSAANPRLCTLPGLSRGGSNNLSDGAGIGAVAGFLAACLAPARPA